MKLLRGTFTAVITPFTDDNQIDYNSLEKIVEMQIERGIDGIVFLGTTGESPTISPEDHQKILQWSTKIVNKRVKVIHGTGSNSTEEALKYSKVAYEAGADAILMVSPYYNKPTQEGLFQHFSKVANEVDLPMIVYNIQGRCGVNIETSTLLRLAENKNIVAVKEASGNIQQMIDVIRQVPEDFSVLVGDDAFTLPFMVCGGDGVISVISNYLPQTMTQLTNNCLKKDWDAAKDLFYKMLDVMKISFIETNPIPAKEIMSLLGYCQPNFRLPMTRATNTSMEKIKEVIRIINNLE